MKTKQTARKTCSIAMLALLAVASAAAQDTSGTNATAMSSQSSMNQAMDDMTGHLSAGIIVGEPTGASVKYWINNTMAVDGAAGWSYRDHSDLYLHGDVLWHNFNLLPVERGQLPVYFGVGGLVRFRHDGRDNDVGIRVPVGISYLFDNIPVEIFAEIGPAIDVAPFVHGEVTGGIGARYRF